MKKGSLFCALFAISTVFGQKGRIEGVVKDSEGPVPFAHVEISQIGMSTSTDESGQFLIAPIDPGTYELMIQAVGYSVQTRFVSVEAGATTKVRINLESSRINLDQVVISGTRSEVPLFEAPVVVSRIDDRIYENTQSVTLSEGLAFSPGLRLENNCQNCGFTQLRMNGLDGAYTQVLINSRPVFSALAGVYGLELIPANMIDRVEVVRGGGSALYGGNAIAGTVNVITKDPIENAFSLGLNQAFVDMESGDRTVSLNGSVVSEDLNTGLNLYGFNRKRDQWDANGDGFSELTLIENTTFGFDAYHKPTSLSRIELNGYVIDEFRRGGNDFDLEPHQSDIAEQLDHGIFGGALAYERYTRDYRHKFSLYASGQLTERHSYYGGGGRVLGEGDELTEEDLLAINAYGNSQDVAAVGGLQYIFDMNPTFTLTLGSEYGFNKVEDRMPGYSRRIEQQVGTVGSYGQLEIKPTDRLTVLAGGRLDFIGIDGVYALNEEQLENESNQTVFVPRTSVMYEFSSDLKIRGSYAQGYRAPQAFDEDLHIETVGGAALFTRLDPKLTTERSDSYTLSLNYAKTSDDYQVNYLVEGFHTDLRNPFITANPIELPNGVAVVTKRNGSGAQVSGVNLEANMAFREKWILNGGLTLQSAEYDQEEEIWSPESPTDANADSLITTSRILRTPGVYGFLSATFKPVSRWSFTYSAIFTGAMQVPHVIDPETEFTVIEETSSFIENSLKVGHTFPINGCKLEVYGGMQNIFNSFQTDFDIGADRDAGYVYGPTRPRTAFFGLKFGWEGE